LARQDEQFAGRRAKLHNDLPALKMPPLKQSLECGNVLRGKVGKGFVVGQLHRFTVADDTRDTFQHTVFAPLQRRIVVVEGQQARSRVILQFGPQVAAQLRGPGQVREQDLPAVFVKPQHQLTEQPAGAFIGRHDVFEMAL
jgi:hypothetical protein